MEFQKELFGNELKRTLEWLSKDPKVFTTINYSYSNESSLEEILQTIDMFIDEQLYIPLTLYLSNEFIDCYGAEFIKRMLIDVLLSLWNKDTLDIAIGAMKKSITAHFKEIQNCANN